MTGVWWGGNGVPTPFCTSKVRCRCGIQTITLKHGCDLTDVLSTRKFALLIKSLQWNRKIHRGNSCRRMPTLFELFGAVFRFVGVGTAFPYLFFSTTSLGNDHADSCNCRNWKVTPDPVSNEIFDLLLFVRYFSSQNKWRKFGDHCFDVCCVN